MIYQRAFLFILLLLTLTKVVEAKEFNDPLTVEEIEAEIQKLMKRGDIPGLSIFMLRGEEEYIRNFGWQDVENKLPVTSETLFQIGSCSKAFTALAFTRLLSEYNLSLEDKVTDYLPWFSVNFEGASQDVTLGQLLHHTSGIPWHTLSDIPMTNAPDALEQTVRTLMGMELQELPGKQYEYATINYDVLAFVIEVVSGEKFEDYLERRVFQTLGLEDTSIGVAMDSSHMAKGYKIGFFKAREYEAPVYKGNNAAGYVNSNITDMRQWLKFQMGTTSAEDLYLLAKETHRRDETVALHDMASYAGGWNISLSGKGTIYHGGLNPNFTAFVAFRPKEKIGVVILANSNSNFTTFMAGKVMKLLAGEEIEQEFDPGDSGDTSFSGLSLAVGVYLLILLIYLGLVLYEAIRGTRKLVPFNARKALIGLRTLLLIVPFLFGLYLIPKAMYGFSWQSAIVWSPQSFLVLVKLLVVAMVFSYLVYLVSLIFPTGEQYKSKIPSILLISILSGFANVVIVIMVTNFVRSDIELIYIVFYFVLTIGLYLFGRRYVQISLINFTRNLVYDLVIKMTGKIFSTSYQKFEKIDRGRVFTALNDDVARVGGSTTTFLSLVTNIITVVGVFVYLASMALWATLLTLSLIISLATVYYLVSVKTNVFFEEARDERNVFMRLINGMIDGYKEISLHLNKKLEYKDDVGASAGSYKDKIILADVRFVNAFLVGEFLLVGLLGFVAFGLPTMFENIEYFTVVSFVVVLLYLLGPINGILGSVPAIMKLRVSWNRLQDFLKEIPANLDLSAHPAEKEANLEQILMQDVSFTYLKENSEHSFSVGPISLEANAGEILFIVGGNGSGKTTLAKLITGLYQPDQGQILLNGKPLKPHEMGEYYSTVFSPPFLFEKLYEVDTEKLRQEVDDYLQLLDLSHKVEINGNRYSTIGLSGGQRKRLSLLQCYLEDSEVFLFDELAADQDPQYRRFFYRELLPKMKQMGKIVIAITHDDQYFDVADQIMRMDEGKLQPYNELTLDSIA
ncbi:MAG: cyclic peptide export ABC transporter [Roseivirga sp.]|nr:cyclic peptide export ABC transporter [Roseivirga sp.]